MRWLLALLIVSGTAHAQAFKPRGGKTAKTEPAKKASAKKASAKKASAKKASAKKAPKKKKKSRLATRGRTDDLTPDADEETKKVAPEEADDYVVIEDDDE